MIILCAKIEHARALHLITHTGQLDEIEKVWRAVKSFDMDLRRKAFFVYIQSDCKKLVKFLWLHFLLFSTVRFQMSPQIAYARGSIVTLVAFV